MPSLPDPPDLTTFDETEGLLDHLAANTNDVVFQSQAVLGNVLLAAVLEPMLQYVCAEKQSGTERMFLRLGQYLHDVTSSVSTRYFQNEFQPIREQCRAWLRHIFLQLLKTDSTASEEEKSVSPRKTTEPNFTRVSSASMFSRLQRDFQIMGNIGRGGFGRVVLARNLVDGNDYAVKLVHVNPSNSHSYLRTMREVKILSSLNHANIVHYHAAWLDFEPRVQRSGVEIREMTSTASTVSESDGLVGRDVEPSSAGKRVNRVDDDDHTASLGTSTQTRNVAAKENVASSSSSSYSANGKFFCRAPNTEMSSLGDGSVPSTSEVKHSEDVLRKNSKERNRNALAPFHSDGALVPRNFFASRMVMSVQMRLYLGTLRNYIEERNARVSGAANVDRPTNLHILLQLLNALDYLHKEGYIHRDVKPKNIFIKAKSNETGAMQIVLGDFGLACRCEPSGSQSVPESVDRQVSLVQRRSAGVGTTTYAAPEQLTSAIYDSKVDLYSVGILGVELYVPFHTSMERARTVLQIRQQHILEPALFLLYPQEAALLHKLTSPRPEQRPTAREAVEVVRSLMERSERREKLKTD